MKTFTQVYAALRRKNKGQYALLTGCCFFSVLLVRFLHPPVGRLLVRVPDFLVDPAALALTAAFTVDVVRSTQAALDLREILTRLTEENEELRRLARRVEVASAFAEDDLRRFREKTEVEKLLLQERLEAGHRQRQEAQARRKLAAFLVEGRPLQIGGGSYALCPQESCRGVSRPCGRCASQDGKEASS